MTKILIARRIGLLTKEEKEKIESELQLARKTGVLAHDNLYEVSVVEVDKVTIESESNE